jgi:hypothetical protein
MPQPPTGTVELGNKSGAVSCDGSQGNRFTLTAVGDVTIDFASVQPGVTYEVNVAQDGTGNRVIAFGSTVDSQGDFIPPGDTAPSTNSIYLFTAVSYSAVELSGYSNYVSTGTQLISKNDTDISIAPGFATNAHASGAAGGTRRGLVQATGKIGTIGGWNGKGSFYTWNHPEAGIIEDKQIFGTPGTPDTSLYVRFAYSKGCRYQMTGGLTDYFIFELTGGGLALYDFAVTAVTSAFRWRTNGGATLFEINPEGVGFGVSPVANQDLSVGFLGIAAPAGGPAAGNALVWFDTTTKSLVVKNDANTYNVMIAKEQGDLGNQTGAVAIDFRANSHLKLKATRNLESWKYMGVCVRRISSVYQKIAHRIIDRYM